MKPTQIVRETELQSLLRHRFFLLSKLTVTRTDTYLWLQLCRTRHSSPNFVGERQSNLFLNSGHTDILTHKSYSFSVRTCKFQMNSTNLTNLTNSKTRNLEYLILLEVNFHLDFLHLPDRILNYLRILKYKIPPFHSIYLASCRPRPNF